MHRGSDFNNTVGDFLEAVKTVGLTEILVAVSTSNAKNRESLEFTNLSNKIMYYGKTGVAISGPSMGIPVYPNDTISLNYNEDVNIYIIAASAGLDLKIVENVS